MALIKTELARQVLHDRSVALSQRQRSALIMCDGKRETAAVVQATSTLGVTMDEVDKLVALGFLKEHGEQVNVSGTVPVSAGVLAVAKPASDRSPQQRYQDAYPLATKITAGLGLRGFRLNLAIEAATSYEALLALAPKIRDAVGPEKFAALDKALND
jgi:hypothetical protein